ncbi:Z1 domain-containing protein [Streptomyces sp. NPDC020422]|uniref:Z1 domain-containing protein n=1 Tax=Streptomyces sp. NPDC020422 TaxID=3365074 RepID=UPI0037A9AD8A
MTDLLNLHGDVLAAMRRGPRPFAPLAAALAETDETADTLWTGFHKQLVAAEPEDDLVALWRRSLTSWDFATEADWSAAPARTTERRADIYARLGATEQVRAALDVLVPVAHEAGAVVISQEFEPWYTQEIATNRAFYWPAYKNHLARKGWSDAAIASLDESSHAVVERLSNPTQAEAYGARGLVVGHVQSGKTANFTGVIAKAIDAGYRLVIVLGGTLNLLREQTQRRLDMELIGQENILRGADPKNLAALVDVDYQDDEDWPDRFITHGGRPSLLGAFDIERLTTRADDYKSLLSGIRALEFEKQVKTLPLYAAENLHRAAARIMVVKKNKSVLTKLVKDLRKIGFLDEVPTLIIDDESDQASVNTTDPKKWESGKVSRTAINGLISELLHRLPRAQYVGYTATPFANVFIDPTDNEDIFPRDFLVSLPRPNGYMGVQDFHDLDSPIPEDERTAANSQEAAHVRSIYPWDDDRLREAIDAFLLTGAIKLYRIDHGLPEGSFRHHTMLAHESVRMDDHADLADRINEMWDNSAYTGPLGHERLERLFTTDFAHVSEAQASHLPTPANYDELRPYISRARQLIGAGGRPTVIVNGDSDRYFAQLDLDFDRTPHVWKILVGGTKLSRGFTVEGLTITYYRRTTRQADTLMQMGRWFGFRPGYRDLVRLYIGRQERLNRSAEVDLYEAFEAICRDEEVFRSELTRYATMVDGRPQVTPAQIPPLVAQHLPWVKPSARNKMFNAELVEIRSPGSPIEPTAHPTDPSDLRHNTLLWRPVLDLLQPNPEEFTYHHQDNGRTYRMSALVGSLQHHQLLAVLENLRWWNAAPFAPHLEFLRGMTAHPEVIDDWLLLVPQHTSNRRLEASILGSRPLALSQRKRRRIELFGNISDPKHRFTARRIAGGLPPTEDVVTERYARPRRGAILLYPVIEKGPDEVIHNGSVAPEQLAMVFSLIAPISATAADQPLVRFRTKVGSAADPQ